MNKTITLMPKYHKLSKDQCEIVFKKKYLEITPIIDSTGNTFRLKYSDILDGMK